jgi:hypothetical protein
MAFSPVVIDGFDNYTVGLQRWKLGQEFHQTTPIDASYTRHSWGGQGAYMRGRSCIIAIPATASVFVGFGMFYDTAFSGLQNFVTLLEKDGVTFHEHCGLSLSESLHPFFTAQSGVVIGPTTGPERVIQRNRWFWVEFFASISNGSGVMELRVNGNPWLTSSGLDTRNDSAPVGQANCIRLSNSFGAEMLVDDVVIQDGSGEFTNDVAVIGKRPTVNGSTNDFSLTGAPSNSQAVDEIAADDDTSYVSASTDGDRDLYEIGDLTELDGTVLAMQECIRARNDGGSTDLRPIIKSGTDEIIGDPFTTTSTYETFLALITTDQPAGGAFGSADDTNALDLEIGQIIEGS